MLSHGRTKFVGNNVDEMFAVARAHNLLVGDFPGGKEFVLGPCA